MQAEEEARKAETHGEDAATLTPADAPATAATETSVAPTEEAPTGGAPTGGAPTGGAPTGGTLTETPAAAPAATAPPANGVARALRRALRQFTRRSDAFLEYLSVEDARRRRAAIVLAVAVNIIIYTALAVFGRFEIWIPAAPRDSISITLVDLEAENVFPELRDLETAPEPEPEPEPEIVEEPEIEPEPAPVPTPKPKPELAPEPQSEPAPAPPDPEPEIDPEPRIDLTPEPEFAPPAEDEMAPFIAEPEPAPSEEIVLPEPEAPAPPVEAPAEEQAPAEEAPPLVAPLAPEPAPSALEVTSSGTDDAAQEDEEDAEDAAALAVEDPAPPVAEAEPSGDDMFDEAPAFGRPRVPLPSVDLPEGQAAALPGQSGVVAIFCPEEFADADKAAECAGRTEIRSGWRPGASGEDWSEAVRLLKQDRAAGRTGTDPSAIYGPRAGGAIKDAEAVRELKDFRRSVDAINDPAGANSGNLNDTFGRPDIGPGEYDPSWTLKEDPELRAKDVRKLERELEEAERAKQPQTDE
jgi:hypothetical protein